MYVQNHIPDTAILLADITASIREQQNTVDQYLAQRGEYAIFNPFQKAVAFQEHLIIAVEKISCPWYHVKNDAILERVKTVVSNCSIIEFAGDASLDAAGFWDGLFTDVIKPLGRRDLEFIFHLGDITSRPVFEVDEMLDIMGDYTSHGRVTLVLDEQEADRLWNKLYGSYYTGRLPDAGQKYQFLFNCMRIDVLLVRFKDRVLLLSGDEQVKFTASPFNNSNVYLQSPHFFQAGYRLGLLLHLDIPHAIILGQVVSGAFGANASIPMTHVLLNYIDEWMLTCSQPVR